MTNETSGTATPDIPRGKRDRTVYIEAYSCDNPSYGAGPQYAKLVVDGHFCEKITRLSALCKAHSLSEVRVYDGPDSWGPPGIEEELRLNCAEMVVTNHGFWFVDHPKHANYSIETRCHDIDKFITVINEGEEPIFLGDNPEQLATQVAEFEGETHEIQ